MTMEDYRRLVETLSDINDLRVENNSEIPRRISGVKGMRKSNEAQRTKIVVRRLSPSAKLEHQQKLGPEITIREEEMSRLDLEISTIKEKISNIREEKSKLPKFEGNWVLKKTKEHKRRSDTMLFLLSGVFLIFLLSRGVSVFAVGALGFLLAWRGRGNFSGISISNKRRNKIEDEWWASEDCRLESKDSDLGVELGKAQSILHHLEIRFSRTEKSLHRMRSKNSKKALDTLKSEISDYDKKISEFDEEKDKLDSEIQKEKGRISSNEEEIERLFESISGLVPYASALTVLDPDSQ